MANTNYQLKALKNNKAERKYTAMEKNKVKLNIGGSEYSFITDDDVKYFRELGREVDLALAQVMKDNPRISLTQAAVLTALDYADEYKKASADADHLREQIKDYLDDAANAKSKADWARRETEKAKKELDEANLENERLKTQLDTVLEQISKKK